MGAHHGARQSTYTMHRDDAADPPVLVCQVGTTTLKYHATGRRGPARLAARAGRLGRPRRRRREEGRQGGTVEAFGRAEDNPVGGWYGLRNGYRGRFGMYLPPLLEDLGLVELTHDARNNRVRAT